MEKIHLDENYRVVKGPAPADEHGMLPAFTPKGMDTYRKLQYIFDEHGKTVSRCAEIASTPARPTTIHSYHQYSCRNKYSGDSFSEEDFTRIVIEYAAAFEAGHQMDFFEITGWSASDIEYIVGLIPSLLEHLSKDDGIRAEKEKEEHRKGLLGLLLSKTHLLERTSNLLARNGIHNLGQLMHSTPDELLEITNFGDRTLEECQRILDYYDLLEESHLELEDDEVEAE